MTTYSDRVAGDPFTGATLDARYRLDSLIGRGGMASVYRGEDLTLGRPVAVKVFAEAAEGIDDTERRRSEIALLASLSHHALVRLYDASRDARTDREFLVMELVEGDDLRRALRRGPISAADAAPLLADVAEALHVIHARGIVHRDVKPANVLLEPGYLPTRTWNAKLADFGIARLIDDARLTRSGLLVGTPGYLSPEQVSGNAPGSAADVYSLGLVVIEARTGRPAFPGPAVEAASARLVRDPEIPASLGDDWVALLRAMTEREPGARPSALEVALAAAHLDTAPRPEAAEGGTAPTTAAGARRPTAATKRLTPAGASGAATAKLTALETADTRVLPVEGQAPAEVGPATAGRRASRRTRRRWVRPAIVVTILAAIAVVAASVLPGVIAGIAEPPPAPVQLPSVPGELGEHLQQLEEAVTP